MSTLVSERKNHVLLKITILLMVGGLICSADSSWAQDGQTTGDKSTTVMVLLPEPPPPQMVEGGTKDDPLNFAQHGYSPKAIKEMYFRNKLDFWVRLGQARARKGDFDGAIAVYNQVLAKSPSHDDSRIQLLFAEAYEGKGNIDLALEHYRKSIYRPGGCPESDPRPLMQYALLLLRIHQYDDALSVCAQAIRYFDETIYGQPVKDLMPLTKSAAVRQLPFVAHLILAFKWTSCNDQAMAVAHAREAIRLRPQEAIGHLCLSVALMVYFEGTREEKLATLAEARKEMVIAAKTSKGALHDNAQRICEAERWIPTG